MVLFPTAGHTPGTVTRIPVLCGILTLIIAGTGLLGVALAIPEIAGFGPEYKSVSFIAAVIWMLLGAVLCCYGTGLHSKTGRIAASGICAAAALIGAVEFPLMFFGHYSPLNEISRTTGDILLSHPTTFMSPVAALLIVVSSVALFILLFADDRKKEDLALRSAVGISGSVTALAGFTLMLSYLYSSPLFYGTWITPTSYVTALAACFTGLGLVAAAGTGSVPLRYFAGTSTRARLLRTFIPLTLLIVVAQNIFHTFLSHRLGTSDSLFLAGVIVLFCLVTSYVVGIASRSIGDALDTAQCQLVKKNEEIQAAYEQIAATEEELRKNYARLEEQSLLLGESEERFHALFDNMSEGMALHELIVDGKGKPADYLILEVNRSYETQWGFARSQVLKKTGSEVYGSARPLFLDRYAAVAQTGTPDVFETYFPGLKKHFRILVYSPKKGQFATIFEDITEQKNNEAAIRLANRKLQLMNIVAWHDIQNKVTGLRGYISLSQDLVTDSALKKMLESEEGILKEIHQRIAETEEYQQIGNKPPAWIDIGAMIGRAIAHKSPQSLNVVVNVSGLEIFADPLIEKAFIELIDNTVLHAKTATEIRIWYRTNREDLVLVYEDNGPGIPQDKKENLFVRTYGTKNFGLFFVHDILELSGITLAETGTAGTGVRFEMTVPKGLYRIRQQTNADA